jgi:NitT/TauT family transport system substrate-binding protein
MKRIRRRSLLQATAACALGIIPAARADEPTTVRILTDWFAQPDQGGYWEAQQEGLGKDAGPRIQVLQGGPKIQTIPQVVAGQAEFGIAAADDLLLARQTGVPVKAIFAHLDYTPRSLVYHTDPAVKSILDLNGRPFAVALGAAYWQWIKVRYGLAPGRVMPVTGDLTMFRDNPKMVQQGLSLYLPARMEAAGIAVSQFTVADLGYRPYYVLFTTDDMIKRHAGVVKQTVAAVKQGWIDFMHDPRTIEASMIKMNGQLQPAIYDAAVRDMADQLVPKNPAGIGCMTPARWTELAKQLASANFLPADFDPAQAYDLSFLGSC